MKKVLTLIFAVLMAVASVRAEEELSITPLWIGDNGVVINNPAGDWKAGDYEVTQYALFSFTAQADGSAAIYAVGSYDTYGVLWDGDFNYIGDSDDDREDNFLFDLEVKAGEVYYIGARGIFSSPGSYIIHVDAPLPPVCEKGHHTMTYVEGSTPATCLTTGLRGYYECSVCYRKYFDAEGEEEADDLTAPALGHHIVDGHCTHEGCDLAVSATPLQLGDNIVDIDRSEWDIGMPQYLRYKLFQYTAQTDALVTVTSHGGNDTYGALFDCNLNVIDENDDSGEERNFLLTFTVHAGEVYYIGVRAYGDNAIEDCTITVEQNLLVAAVGDYLYCSLFDALGKIANGETLTLLSDVESESGENDEMYEVFTKITLDLNGHTIFGYIHNYSHLTIEDSSEDKSGRIEAADVTLLNYSSGNSITINGGTFVGGPITSSNGTYYINGGTFILSDESYVDYVMSVDDNVVFGEGVVYRDLSGERDDITEVTESVTYSGTFVNTTATAIKNISAPAAQKAIKTIENGRVVIIRGGEKWDLSGRKL